MNDANRYAIVVVAALAIILMAVFILLAWAADSESIDRLADLVQYLRNHDDNPGKLILTLGALTVIGIALLVIVLELAPESEAAQSKEIRVDQAGATTIIPLPVVLQRLEAALRAIPGTRTAKVQVASRNQGVQVSANLTVALAANLAAVSQEASHAVTDVLQNELGLPLSQPPIIRITPSIEGPAASVPASEEQS